MHSLRSVASVLVSVASALITVAPLLVTASYAAAPATSQVASAQLVGAAKALDGDTIDLATHAGVVRVRLEGIDAAEGGQRCNLRWIGTWDCGRAATIALEQLVNGHVVTCDNLGIDKYGRTLGICTANGRSLNGEMVRVGLAWAYVHYSTRFVPEEREARSARVGIWQAATMPPWEWRLQQRARTAQRADPVAPQQRSQPLMTAPSRAAVPAVTAEAAPPGCDIKGNVTQNGRIYHTTASPWYERVRMSLGSGRRWFCSEAEAQEAGFRPAGAASAQ